MDGGRLKPGFFFACVSFLGTALALAGGVRAGTIRHDVDPQAYIDFANQPQYAAVGEVDATYLRPEAVGSGTLIAPNWVLTAAHLLEGATNVTYKINGKTYNASRWVVHPKYDGDLHRGYDLGLVQLSETIDDIVPARLYRGRGEFSAIGAFIGFGKTGTGMTGATTDDRLKRGGTNEINGYVRSNKFGQPDYVRTLPRSARTFAVDFDNPLSITDSTLGTPFPTALEYLIAPGDSGGPTFITNPRTGLAEVAGVHSFAEIPDGIDDSDYGDVAGETRVSKFASWIDGVVAQKRKYRRLEYVTPHDLSFNALPRSLLLPEGSSPIPEPTSLSLLVAAGVALLARRRR